MRTVEFITPQTLNIRLNTLAKEPGLPFVDAARAFLQDEVDHKRIVRSTFESYLVDLRAVAKRVGATDPSTAEFAIAIRHALRDATTKSTRSLRRAILVRLAEHAHWSQAIRHELTLSVRARAGRRPLLRDPEAMPTGAAYTPLAIDFTTLARIHARTERVLETIRTNHKRHVRYTTRAAMIAMCRYAAARPSDLVALTIGDLIGENDKYRSPADLQATYTVMRTKRGKVGAEKQTECKVALPAEAAQWLAHYIEVAYPQMALDKSTVVFLNPDSPDKNHLLAFDRLMISRIVSGFQRSYCLTDEDAIGILATPLHGPSILNRVPLPARGPVMSVPAVPATGRATMIDALDAAATVNTTAGGPEKPPRMNPQHLYHCLAIEMVHLHPYFSPADLAILKARLGWISTGSLRRYRDAITSAGIALAPDADRAVRRAAASRGDVQVTTAA